VEAGKSKVNGQLMNKERQRLEQQKTGETDWLQWGPYLSERAWGTVREDYSEHGTAPIAGMKTGWPVSVMINSCCVFRLPYGMAKMPYSRNALLD